MIGETIIYLAGIICVGILAAQMIAAVTGRALHITKSAFTFLAKDK